MFHLSFEVKFLFCKTLKEQQVSSLNEQALIEDDDDDDVSGECVL